MQNDAKMPESMPDLAELHRDCTGVDLESLAARCRTTGDPDRRIDVLIGCEVRYVPDKPGCEWAKAEHWQYIPMPRISERIACADKSGNVAAHWDAPAYTASLDAALSLVPADAFWKVGHDGEGPDPSVFSAVVGVAMADGSITFRKARGVTAPLALAGAALRARAAS